MPSSASTTARWRTASGAWAGNRAGVGDALSSLGKVYARRGDYAEAKDHYQRAIEVFRDFGAAFDEALALIDLGKALAEEGDQRAAGDAWRAAQDILERLAHPLADDVKARLASLDDGADNDSLGLAPGYGPELAGHDQGSPRRPL
jgi:tetratricopeptide (TPR) repeat protein